LHNIHKITREAEVSGSIPDESTYMQLKKYFLGEDTDKHLCLNEVIDRLRPL